MISSLKFTLTSNPNVRASMTSTASFQFRSHFRQPYNSGFRTLSVSGFPVGFVRFRTLSGSVPPVGFGRYRTLSDSSFPACFGRGLLLFSRSNSRNKRWRLLSSSSPAFRFDIESEEEASPLIIEMEDSCEEQTLKFCASEEAFEVHYKKITMVKSKEASENLKFQTDKTRKNLNVIEMEHSEEGKYVSVAADNSPEPKKDIVKPLPSPTDDLIDVSKVHSLYVRIPYSALLPLGGIFSFMITGCICPTRFNIILGGVFLALSIYGLRSQIESCVAIKGQAAIVTLLFLRQAHLVLMIPRVTGCISTLLSGAVLAFYMNRILYSIGQTKAGPSLET